MAPAFAPHTVYIVQAHVAAPPVPFSTLLPVVSADERARAERYFHDIDRHRHLIGRGLVRLAIGGAKGVSRTVVSRAPRIAGWGAAQRAMPAGVHSRRRDPRVYARRQ